MNIFEQEGGTCLVGKEITVHAHPPCRASGRDVVRLAERKREVMVRFGIAVKALRDQLGISQEELATRAGLHRTYISDVERGTRNITLASIDALAPALGVPMTSLLGEVESGEG